MRYLALAGTRYLTRPPPSDRVCSVLPTTTYNPAAGDGCDLRFPKTKVRFVDRAGASAGLRGAGIQPDYTRSDSAEIGWNPCGTVPHSVPHGIS